MTIMWYINNNLRAVYKSKKLKEENIMWVPMVRFYNSYDSIKWLGWSINYFITFSISITYFNKCTVTMDCPSSRALLWESLALVISCWVWVNNFSKLWIRCLLVFKSLCRAPSWLRWRSSNNLIKLYWKRLIISWKWYQNQSLRNSKWNN